jgi:RNA polymerase sigma factor (sigma-70 family)
LLRRLRTLKLELGDPLNDRQLLAEFVGKRDEVAFAELVRRHGTLVWSVCRRVCPTIPDAEDALQVTFLVLARKARTIKQPERLTGWLYGVALRSARGIRLMNTRRHRADRLRPAQSGIVEEPGAGRDDLEILDQELSKLASRYRDVVLLCQLQGLSRKEAASRLGIAEGTVSSRLAMAKRKLARRLKARGVSLGCVATATVVNGSVSASLVQKTADSATAASRGQTGIVSPHLLSAAERVIKSMMLGELRSLATRFAVLAGFAVACTAALWPAGPAPALAEPTAPQPVARAVAQEPTGYLTGCVTDPDGKPVAGARVWSRSHAAKTPQAETTTDADGKYRLGPIKSTAGRAGPDLFVEAPGFARQYVVCPVAFPGSERDAERIVLTRGQRVRGRLIDVDGKPRAAIAVEICLNRYVIGHTIQQLGEPYRLTTDAHGRFESPPLPCTPGWIIARIPDRVDVRKNLELSPGKDQDIQVRLEPDKPIVVQVETEDGKPVVGARLRGMWGYDDLISNKQGRIVIRGMDNLPPALFRLEADGYPQHDVRLAHFENKIVLKKPAYLCGKAIDADTGKPVKLTGISICRLRKLRDGRTEPFG